MGQRRKVEGDLKVTPEVVIDLERDKKDVEGCIENKDKDIHDSQNRLADEQSIVGKLQKPSKSCRDALSKMKKNLKEKGGLVQMLKNKEEDCQESLMIFQSVWMKQEVLQWHRLT